MSREKAEQRRGFDPDAPPKDRAKGRSLFFDDLLDDKVRVFNPRYTEAEGALLGQFRHLHTDIYGNREFVEHLRNRGKLYDVDAKRERDLILIDYADPTKNVYEVTEEEVPFGSDPVERSGRDYFCKKYLKRPTMGYIVPN